MVISENRLGPSPGQRRYPHHSITIQPARQCWQARSGSQVIAVSEHALILSERGYNDVVYFPLRDVRRERLVPSDSETTCPFKGTAEYFKLMESGPDVAWVYPETYDEVSAIAGHVAFYPEHIAVEPVTKP